MDAQAVIMGISGIGSVAVGIAIGRQMTIRRDLNNLGQKIHKIEDWRTTALTKQLDEVYARKDTIGAELRAIRDTLHRLERLLEPRGTT